MVGFSAITKNWTWREFTVSCNFTKDDELKKQLVYIAGSSRTGSTLLDLLLNNHDKIMSVGELDRIAFFLNRSGETCSCGKCVNECEFWRHVQHLGCKNIGVDLDTPLLERRLPSYRVNCVSAMQKYFHKLILVQPFRSLYQLAICSVLRPYRQAGLNCFFWFEMIRQASGCPIIVDSSKVALRMKALYYMEPWSYRIIHMIRDGRAVAASEIRRTGRPMQVAANRWQMAQKKVFWCLKGIPKTQVYRLRYEIFCQDPETSMREICDFIGVKYEPNLLTLKKHDIHNIGGNPMRFKRNDLDIKLDERWKQQLDQNELDTFNQIAGKFNRSLGYE